MKGFVSEGKVLEFTAPAGGVTAGTGVKIGDILVIAAVSAAAGARFNGVRAGVFHHDKNDAEAWTEGQQVNWDAGNNRFTTATTGNYKAGVAAAAAANPTDKGYVLLHGVSLGAALA